MTDAITAAVIRESFASIVREMRRSFAASAYSSIIYEGYDFSCVLIDRHGRLVAQSGEDHPFHIIPVAWSVSGLLEKGVNINDDTLFLHNDPYTGGTHLNDVAVVYPVFQNGAAAFFIVLRAHWGDIGGMTPGSLSGAAREILQEGLRLNHVPVPKSGQSPVMDLIFDNVRVTREAMADFHAAIGTCRVAEQRLLAVIEKHGLDVVEAAGDEMLNAAERRMRTAIRTVPDGTYRFTSYLDGHDLEHFPLLVDVSLEFRDDSVRADFTGTASQVPAPLNAGPAIAPTSVLTVLKSFLDPAGVINSGTLRPIDIHVPPGTILHALHPAPCGGLNEVRFASDAAVMGALGQAVPERMTGDVRGSTNHTYVGGTIPNDGRDFIFYEYPSGGTGGFTQSDGNPAVRAFNEGENVSIQSSEMVERIFPLRIVRNELRPDSGGAGQFRGGAGLHREVEVQGPDARFSLLSDRNVVPPYGVNGGRSGQGNRFSVLRDGVAVETSSFPGKVTGFALQAGDVVRMESSGGGGFGYAEQRSTEALIDDLLDGVVTVDGASNYGVAVDVQGARPSERQQGTASPFASDFVDRSLCEEVIRPLPEPGNSLPDERAAPTITFDFADDPGTNESSHPAHCGISAALASQYAVQIGQMLELVPERGAPLRFWVTKLIGDADLCLRPRWRDRLPVGPYRLRFTSVGTPTYLRDNS